MRPLLVSFISPARAYVFFHSHLHICYLGGAFGAPAAGELSIREREREEKENFFFFFLHDLTLSIDVHVLHRGSLWSTRCW